MGTGRLCPRDFCVIIRQTVPGFCNKLTASDLKEEMPMSRTINLIIKCPVCGKVHESAQIMRPVNDEVAALWMSCPEKNQLFLPKETKMALAEYYAEKMRGDKKHNR